MKRIHIHISVDDLEQSTAFYTAQFAAKPTKIKADYVQWLLDDPALNFAMSTRGYKKGLNHLGIQYDSDAALNKAQMDFESAGIVGKVEEQATCCYKASNKYWVSDPTGIVWENYHSMEDVEIFGVDVTNTEDGCCMPSFGDGASSCKPQAGAGDGCCAQ